MKIEIQKIIAFENKKQIFIALMLSSFLSVLFLALRILISSQISYIFLVWNLFLAWIPFILSLVLKNLEKKTKSRIALMGIFFTWLLFFPNAPYILTDLIHLKNKSNVPIWYDMLLISSFAWNGLILGFCSLFEIHRILNKRYSVKKSWVIVSSLIFMAGFGIYLGRFERWNSWDILTNPLNLIITILEKFAYPLQNSHAILATIVFSLFLLISYLTLSVLIKPNNYEQSNSQ